LAIAVLLGLAIQAIARHRLASFVILAPVTLAITLIVVVVWHGRTSPVYSDPPICEVTLPAALLRRLDPGGTFTWADTIARCPVRRGPPRGRLSIDLGAKSIDPPISVWPSRSS
jgi:hypothetical protein